MGRPEFTRSITETTIKASVVKIENGAIVTTPCEPFTVDDKVSEDKALSLVKAKYGKKQQYVVEMSYVEETWAISKENLKLHGHKVEPKPENTREGNKAE